MAARAHWRFVVRDESGSAIQNAAVYVYQPGTTSDFSGSAYDAYTAGSAKTNPFTTNAQGEVEGWFDTAQRVDVFVTDNNDTAYRAGDSSSAVVSWTSFTEEDEIRPSVADTPTAVGVAGDLSAIDGGDTASAGTSGRYADAGHQHAVTAAAGGDIAAGLVNPFTAVTAVAGAATKLANAAHVHPYSALTPAAAVRPRTTAGAGTLLNPAREDHIHPFVSNLGLTSKTTKTAAAEEVIGNALTIAANTLAAGSMFRISMYGYETNGTTGITFTFRIRYGGLAGVIIGSALAITGTTTAHTDNPMQLEFLMTVQSIGATGTATGSWFGAETLTTTTANTPKLVLDVQAAAATIDTTAQKDLVMTLQLSATTGTPQLEVDNLSIVQVA
jgi:hypothetical protein